MLHQPFFTGAVAPQRSAQDIGVRSLNFLLSSCMASLDDSILDTEIERVPLVVDNESSTRQSTVAALAKASIRSGVLNWAETQEVQAMFYLTGGLSEFAIKGAYSGLAESPANRWGFDGPLTLSPASDDTQITSFTATGTPVFTSEVWDLATTTKQTIPARAMSARVNGTVLQRSVSGLNRIVEPRASASFDGYWGPFNVPVIIELYSNGYQVYASTGALLASVGGTTPFHTSSLTTGFSRCYSGAQSTILYNDGTDVVTFLRNGGTLTVPNLVGAFDSQDQWYFCAGANILNFQGDLVQSLGGPIRGVTQLGQDVYITTDAAVYFWEPTQLKAVSLGDTGYNNVVATFAVGSELIHVQQTNTSPGDVGVFVAGSSGSYTGFIGFASGVLPGAGQTLTSVSYTDQGVLLNFGRSTGTRHGLLFRRDRNEIYVTGGSGVFLTGLCGGIRWLSGGCGRLSYHTPSAVSTYTCTSTDSSDPYYLDLRVVRSVDDAPPFSALPAYYDGAITSNGWQIHYRASEYSWTPPDPTSVCIPIGVVTRGEPATPYAVVRTVMRNTAVPSYVDTLEPITLVGFSPLLTDCVVAGNATVTQYLTQVAGSVGDGALVWQDHLRGGLRFNERFYLNSRFGPPVSKIDWSYDPIHHNTELWTTWDSPVMFSTPSGIFTAKPGVTLSAVERSTGFDGDSFSYTIPSANVTDLNSEVHVSVGPAAFVTSRPVVAHRAVELWVATLEPGPPVRMDLYLTGYQSQVKTEGTSTTIDVSGWETRLQSVVNLSVQYNCVHAFGGIRCGVDPTLHYGVVDFIEPALPSVINVSTASLPLPLPLSRYEFGTLRILTGPFAGLEYSVERIVGSEVTIAGTAPGDILGETFVIAQGCKKSYAGCVENNNDRYLGFPQVPGTARAYIASTSI